MSVYRRERSKYWWCKFTGPNGQQIRRSTQETTRAAALKFERRLRVRVKEQARRGRPAYRYEDAMNRFIEEHIPTLRAGAQRRYFTSMRVLTPHFEGVELQDIGRGELSDFITARRQVAKDATIRRDLACLSSMFACAVRWDWCDRNPVKDFDKKHVRESKPRVRYLTPEEYDAILAAAPDDLRGIVVVLKETGLRLGELLALTWADIEDDRLYVRDSKTGAPRVVPLSDQAMGTLLGTLRHLHDPRIWYGRTMTVRNVSMRLKRLFQRAGIKDFRPHDLRHTFASWAIQGRHPWQTRPMPIERLKVWLGHRRLEQTMKYAHLAIDDLANEVETVGHTFGHTVDGLGTADSGKAGAKKPN